LFFAKSDNIRPIFYLFINFFSLNPLLDTFLGELNCIDGKGQDISDAREGNFNCH